MSQHKHQRFQSWNQHPPAPAEERMSLKMKSWLPRFGWSTFYMSFQVDFDKKVSLKQYLGIEVLFPKGPPGPLYQYHWNTFIANGNSSCGHNMSPYRWMKVEVCIWGFPKLPHLPKPFWISCIVEFSYRNWEISCCTNSKELLKPQRAAHEIHGLKPRPIHKTHLER